MEEEGESTGKGKSKLLTRRNKWLRRSSEWTAWSWVSYVTGTVLVESYVSSNRRKSYDGDSPGQLESCCLLHARESPFWRSVRTPSNQFKCLWCSKYISRRRCTKIINISNSYASSIWNRIYRHAQNKHRQIKIKSKRTLSKHGKCVTYDNKQWE